MKWMDVLDMFGARKWGSLSRSKPWEAVTLSIQTCIILFVRSLQSLDTGYRFGRNVEFKARHSPEENVNPFRV